MKLYGTPTSPYTRKIRILARAAGVPADLVDTRTEEGAAALSRIAPLGKVPVAALTAEEVASTSPVESWGAPGVLADSGLIADWLWAHHEGALRAAGFALAPHDWQERARTLIVEGALDAAINRFYLLRDGLPDTGYVTRQGQRVVTTLDWLDASLDAAPGPLRFPRPCSGWALSLGCALDWMRLRQAADLSRTPRLQAFHAAWLASTIGAGTEPG